MAALLWLTATTCMHGRINSSACGLVRQEHHHVMIWMQVLDAVAQIFLLHS
jgi:hypothetical protein